MKGIFKCPNRRGRPLGEAKVWVGNAICYKTLGRLPEPKQAHLEDIVGKIADRFDTRELDKQTMIKLIIKSLGQYMGGSFYCGSCKAFVDVTWDGGWVCGTQEAKTQDFKKIAKVKVRCHQMVVA